MAYFLGFDGGGTKTECVLVDAEGQVLGRGFAGPSNPIRSGFKKAVGCLQAAAATTLKAAGVQAIDVLAICAGLAGVGRPRIAGRVQCFLEHAFPQAAVHVTTDLELALEAAAESGPAVVLVSGTGSAAYGRNAAGEKARAGGWGAWIGDEGSGSDIGRHALAAVARGRDHLAPATHFESKILTGLECPDWEAVIELVARKPLEVLPRIFPMVAEAAAAGDETAQTILTGAAKDLATLAGGVIRRLGLNDEEFVLAKFGGVFKGSAYLDASLTESLRMIAPRARIERPDASAAVVAARLAKRRAHA